MSKISPDSPKYWERLLRSEGMPSELPEEENGQRIRLGDGLGRKSDRQEALEDTGLYHSSMCPIKLGRRIDGNLDQPNDRPLEDR